MRQRAVRCLAGALALGLSSACARGPAAPVERPAPRPEPPPAVAKAAPWVDVPIERLPSGHLAVAVRTGKGQELRFLLDTGASVTVVTPKTRELLGIGGSEGTRARAKAAGGNAGAVRLVELPRLSLGGRPLEDVTAAVMHLDHLNEPLGAEPAGVLGQNVFAAYVVEFDLAAGRLRLYERDAAPAWDEPARLVPLGRTGLFAVEARIDPGAVDVLAVVDLGAGRTVVNHPAAEAAGIDPRALGQRESIHGASQGEIEAAVHTFERLSVGGVVVERPRLLVAQLPVFRPLGLARRPAVILGFDQLDGRIVGLDIEGRRFHLGPAKAR